MKISNQLSESPRASDLFEVGETLKCLQYVARKDRESAIFAGELVKVTQAYTFTFEGKRRQDITVQRGRQLPIAVLVEPGCFERVPVD